MQKEQKIDTSNVFGQSNSNDGIRGVDFSHKHLATQEKTANTTVISPDGAAYVKGSDVHVPSSETATVDNPVKNTPPTDGTNVQGAAHVNPNNVTLRGNSTDGMPVGK